MFKIKINTTVILAVIIVLTALCTWFIPAGSYDKQIVDGRQILVEGSFHYIDKSPQSLFDVLKAPMQSFARSTTAEIMAFLLIIGGAFMIIEKTGAITAAIKMLTGVDKDNVRVVMIKNTLSLSEIYLSEALLPQAEADGRMEVLEEPHPMEFDADGALRAF